MLFISVRNQSFFTPIVENNPFTCTIQVEHVSEGTCVTVEEELYPFFACDVILATDQPEVIAELQYFVGRGGPTQTTESRLREPIKRRPHHLVSLSANVQDGASWTLNVAEYQLNARRWMPVDGIWKEFRRVVFVVVWVALLTRFQQRSALSDTIPFMVFLFNSNKIIEFS